MAFPFTFYEGFENGTLGAFNSETDNDAKLNYIDYKAMARITGADGHAEVPYQGAYAMWVNLAGGTSAAYVQENDGFDTSAAATLFVRFYLYVTEDLVTAASDRFDIFTMMETGNAQEVTVGIRNNSGAIQLIVSETASSTPSAIALPLGQWNLVEVKAVIDSGGNDGTIDAWLNGAALTQITGLTQGPITHARLGTINIDAGTTKGHLFFDEVVSDDARIYGIDQRFPYSTMRLAGDMHPVVGPGAAYLAVTGTGTDAVALIYDSDSGSLNTSSQPIATIRQGNSTAEVKDYMHKLEFQTGLFIDLAGTNAQCIVHIDDATHWNSVASAVNYAFKR